MAAPNPILADIEAGGRSAQQSDIDISAVMTQSAEAMRGVADAARDAAVDASTVSTAAGRAALDTQTAYTSVANAIGGNAKDIASELLTGLGIKLREDFDKADAAKQKSDQLDSISFFDDPLQWFGANLLGGADKARTQYNAAATTYNNDKSRMDGIIASTNAAVITQKALSTPVTADSIAAASRVAAFDYTARAAQFQYQSFSSDVEALKAIRDGNKSVIDAKLEAWKVNRSDEELAIQKGNAAIARAHFDIIVKEYNEKQEAKQTFDAVVNAGWGVYGMKQPDSEQLKQIRVLYQTPEGKKELQPIVDAGREKLLNGNVSYGYGPSDSFRNIVKLDAKNLVKDTNGNSVAVKYLIDTVSGIDKTTITKPAQLDEKIDQKVKNDVTVWSNNPDRDGSLYKAPPTIAIFTAVPSLKETPLYQKVLGPQMIAGLQDVTPTDMVSKVSAAIDAKELSIEQARDGIAKYYQAAIQLNAVRNSSVGIPPQPGYRAKIGSTGIFSDSSYDMSKPATVGAAILQYRNRTNRDIIPGVPQ